MKLQPLVSIGIIVLFLTLMVSPTVHGEEIQTIPFSVTLSPYEYKIIDVPFQDDSITKIVIHAQMDSPTGTYETFYNPITEEFDSLSYACGITYAFTQSGVDQFENMQEERLEDGYSLTYSGDFILSSKDYEKTIDTNMNYKEFFVILWNDYSYDDASDHETTVRVSGTIEVYRETPINFTFWFIVIAVVGVIGYAIYSFIKNPPMGGWRKDAAVHKHHQETGQYPRYPN